jgi:hypothetical protein
MNDADFLIDLQNILRPQVITSSGTGADIPKTSGMDGRARAIVRVGALSASTVFTAKLEHSDDGASNWSDVPGGAFPAINTANSGASIGIDTAAMKEFVRVSYTAVGGTPNLVASGFLLGFRNRVN